MANISRQPSRERVENWIFMMLVLACLLLGGYVMIMMWP